MKADPPGVPAEGANSLTESSRTEQGPKRLAPALIRNSIQRSAWKVNSANFAYPQFSEVRRRASEGDIMLTVERVAR